MAFKFGKKSLKRLETTKPFVQEIMHEVLSISPYDLAYQSLAVAELLNNKNS